MGEPPAGIPGKAASSCLDAEGKIAYAVKQVQSYLRWIDEHRASYERYRPMDQDAADNELHYLKDATAQAIYYANLLAELLRVGEGRPDQ